MTLYAEVADDGQLFLPADVADRLGWAPGDTLFLEEDAGKLVIRSYREVVREGQERFRALLPTDYAGSLANELAADRRAEAGS